MIGLPKTFVARGAVLSIGMQGFSKVMMLGITILLARVLGADDFGLYSTAIAWMSIGTMIAMLGLQQSSVRLIVQYRDAGETEKLNGFVAYAGRAVLIAGLVVGMVSGGVIWLAYDAPQAAALFVVMPLILANSLSELYQSMLAGFKWVARALVSKHVLYPLFTIAAMAVYFQIEGELTLRAALKATVYGLGAAALYGAFWLRKCSDNHAEKDEGDKPKWRSAMGWNMLNNAVIAVHNNIGIIALSIWVGVVEAAMFAIAMRFFDVMLFVQRAMAVPLAAGLAERGKTMQVRFTRAAWLSVLFSVPFVALMAMAGQGVLVVVFGSAYGESLLAVMIVVVSTAVIAACGPCGVLLIARGCDKELAVLSGAAVAIGMVVLVFTLQDYGAVGAAVAFATGAVLNNIGAVWLAYRKCGVVPSIFGQLR